MTTPTEAQRAAWLATATELSGPAGPGWLAAVIDGRLTRVACGPAGFLALSAAADRCGFVILGFGARGARYEVQIHWPGAGDQLAQRALL